MMKKTKVPAFIVIILLVVAASCKTSQPSAPQAFQKAQKVYDSTTREIAKEIRKLPTTDFVLADSFKMPAYPVVTTNFGMRRPNMVILHHTAQDSCEQTLQHFATQKTAVSAHYLICKDGTLNHLLNDYLRAWHAGAGKWGSNTDINSSSIGIELDNNGREAFTPAQINTLLGLLDTLARKYNIPKNNYLAHADIAPVRKSDPNVHFPWRQLAENGFGLWYGDTSEVVVPKDFSAPMALKVIGYDISNYQAALLAFKRHFLHKENDAALGLEEQKVLYALMLEQMK